MGLGLDKYRFILVASGVIDLYPDWIGIVYTCSLGRYSLYTCSLRFGFGLVAPGGIDLYSDLDSDLDRYRFILVASGGIDLYLWVWGYLLLLLRFGFGLVVLYNSIYFRSVPK
jgi:hypothetical protein